jgi:23S rRNA (adenine2503-C2)-methyltransferase
VPESLTRLGHPASEFATAELDTQTLVVNQQHDSGLDESTKLVMCARDRALFETVLLKSHTGRTAVCVSTQVGCQAGCVFCATARMGLKRQLTAAEIVEQVLIAGRMAASQQRRLRNVVFMGMGEPLDNEAGLHAALSILLSESGCRFPSRRLLVSTVGVPAAMLRLADRFPGVPIALSLHSARPELRRKLIPWAKHTGWDELRDALHEIARRPATHRHQGPVMIEHLLLEGVNDSNEDADALIEYLGGLRVHVNLIPYNPIPQTPQWRPTPRVERDRFAERIRAAGLFTTIRYSMGADVQAACGQLVQSSV